MRLFSNKIYNIIRTVIFIALAIVVAVLMETLVAHLKFFIGALMIFYGAEEILYTFFNSKKRYSIRALYWNAVEILIGLILIIFVKHEELDYMYTVICVSWATWSILRETRELVEATEEIKKHVSAIPNILESLVIIGFSLTLIINPTDHHATIHMYLLTVELVSKVLFPVIDNAQAMIKQKREAKAQTASALQAEVAEGELAADEDEEISDKPEQVL